MKQKVIPLVRKSVGVRDLNDAERNLLLTAGFATAECCHCCCHCHHHHCCCYCWESNHCAGLHIQNMTSNHIINTDLCSQHLSIYKLFHECSKYMNTFKDNVHNFVKECLETGL